MQPIPPFWFKQRQAKLEAAGDNVYKATAPNQGDAFLLIRKDETDRWSAAIRASADGEDVVASNTRFVHPGHAWEVAFELYRQTLLV